MSELTLAEAEQTLLRLAWHWADGISMLDIDRACEAYFEDGVWKVAPPINYEYRGRDAIASKLKDALSGLDVLVQTVGSCVVTDFSDTHIRGRNLIEEQGRRSADAGLHNLGMYENHIEKRHGEWRFAERRATLFAMNSTEVRAWDVMSR